MVMVFIAFKNNYRLLYLFYAEFHVLYGKITEFREDEIL